MVQRQGNVPPRSDKNHDYSIWRLVPVPPPRTYRLNGINLEVVKSEKDLEVMIVNDTSWREHIVTIVARANRMLGFLKRNCVGLVDSDALLL